ncbi:tungstate ABC transporter substrate-binding protein WtpA [candidate division WOR-3 bacterium]|nr:tungstate ABC transporter substrate-binding protein WtpA [candidate division WOR-3 bacterium]
MRKASSIKVFILLITLMSAVWGCSKKPEMAELQPTVLSIYHAGSLSVPFESLKAEFQKDHPNVEIIIESGGSAGLINKIITVVEAGEVPPDIMASADYKLIPSRLYEKDLADWYIAFARNELVLCYRDGAPFSEEIHNGTRTWYEVLKNEPVSYGHSNPDDDPCGYRSLMVIQLAELVYFERAFDFGLEADPEAEMLYDVLIPGSEEERGRSGGENTDARPGKSQEIVRTKSVDLISSLQSGDLDYAFEYRSVAVQHDLNYIDLHPAINLGSIGQIEGAEFLYEDFYQNATIKILAEIDPEKVYKDMKGEPVVYGIASIKSGQNREMAYEFIALLLSEKGQQLMEESGQPFLNPLVCDHPENLPQLLKSFFE